MCLTSAIAKSRTGVIVQFGGQTPLNLAAGLKAAGVPIIGTSVESIERAEDRKLFQQMLNKLGLNQPPNGTATNEEEAVAAAEKVGYPVLVRPSFVLGGRAMQIVYSDDELRYYMRNAVAASPERPVLVDRFLDDATEVDVDCIADGEIAVIGAIMEHIEQAGVHSGDSACVIPAPTLSEKVKEEIRGATIKMAKALDVRGLMNVQFAVKDETVYVLEVNPARLAHRALRQQGDRRAAGQAGREGDDRYEAQGPRLHEGNYSPPLPRSRRPFSRSRNSAAPTSCSAQR